MRRKVARFEPKAKVYRIPNSEVEIIISQDRKGDVSIGFKTGRKATDRLSYIMPAFRPEIIAALGFPTSPGQIPLEQCGDLEEVARG